MLKLSWKCICRQTSDKNVPLFTSNIIKRVKQVLWVHSSDKMTPIYFVRLSKVWSMLHHGSVWLVHKKIYLKLLCAFLAYFYCFSSQNLCFYHFHFFFWWSIKFPQQNINQSETWISGFQLSVELYAMTSQSESLSCYSVNLLSRCERKYVDTVQNAFQKKCIKIQSTIKIKEKKQKNMIVNYESIKERLFKECWKAVIKSQRNSQLE